MKKGKIRWSVRNERRRSTRRLGRAKKLNGHNHKRRGFAVSRTVTRHSFWWLDVLVDVAVNPFERGFLNLNSGRFRSILHSVA